MKLFWLFLLSILTVNGVNLTCGDFHKAFTAICNELGAAMPTALKNIGSCQSTCKDDNCKDSCSQTYFMKIIDPKVLDPIVDCVKQNRNDITMFSNCTKVDQKTANTTMSCLENCKNESSCELECELDLYQFKKKGGFQKSSLATNLNLPNFIVLFILSSFMIILL
ncbi:hypothetical protein K502DRAFT_367510 [Neoconidiobolus thromboides FSU 785]|nr:hypothetical protein K502DRAFT_367510 [Neoconidiobolus thromboides FSU 785]